MMQQQPVLAQCLNEIATLLLVIGVHPSSLLEAVFNPKLVGSDCSEFSEFSGALAINDNRGARGANLPDLLMFNTDQI